MSNDVWQMIEPAADHVPLVFDSPHSGTDWPEDWHPTASREDLLKGWDAFIDELFGAAPENGASLLRAFFPRTFVDLNRRRDDIDPALIEGTWATELKPGPKSEVGMGLLRRFAIPGVAVYDRPLPVETVRRWVETYYDPYHDALKARLDMLHARFGFVRHVDCHSMKSRGNAMNVDCGLPRPDFVVSDRDGTTSDPAFTKEVAALLGKRGYSVWINDPYKGAELIARYASPAENRYSVQIEVNRALYMNEVEFTKSSNFATLKADLDGFVHDLAGLIRSST